MFLILVLYSCGSTKTSLAQDWINSQKFTVVKPNNWRAVKNHGYVSYTPLKKGENFYENMVSVFQFQLKEKPAFREFVQNQIKQANKNQRITSQELLTENSKFGNIYILKTESIWNRKNYKKQTIYTEYNGKYYYYVYSSLKSKYKKHYNDAISIYQSIEFKR